MALHLKTAQAKKHNFDFSHDVVTTSNFGLYQPTLCREIVPNSTINVNNQSFVRLANMVCPTFGRMSLKTHFAFVPMTSIFPHFVEFLNQQKVSNANGILFQYTKLPSFKFLSILAGISYAPISKITGTRPFIHSVDWCFFASPFGPNTDNQPLPDDGSSPAALTYQSIDTTSFDGDVQFFNRYSQFNKSEADILLTKTGNQTFTFTTVGGQKLIIDFDAPIGEPNAQYLGLRFTGMTKRLFDILRGLGFVGASFFSDDSYSILPILAYIRAYFDLFSPKRENNFETTFAHSLKTKFQYQDGQDIDADVIGDLLVELITYYTYKPDYFTASLPTINNGVDASLTLLNGSQQKDVEEVTSKNNVQASSQTTNGMSAIQVQGLLQMAKYVNRTTHVGRQALEWLRSKFGVSAPSQMYTNTFHIGTCNCDIQISDLYATANSAGEFGTNLGDYTGRGIGADSSQNFTFEAKEFGYLIAFTTIVPRSGYFEGLKPHISRLTPLQFFTSEFDGLGYQAIPQNEVVGGISRKVFGFVPRYSDYKYETNLVNGDFYGSDELSAYHLNRMFNPVSVRQGHASGAKDDINIVNDNAFRTYSDDVNSCAQTMLRIFANTDTDVDHFLIFMRNNLHIAQPMKSISETIDVQNGVGDFNIQYT